MKNIFRGGAILALVSTSTICGSLAGFQYYAATDATIQATIAEVEKAITERTSPQIHLGERQNLPFSPLLLAICAVSGVAGMILILDWLWDWKLLERELTSLGKSTELPPTTLPTVAIPLHIPTVVQQPETIVQPTGIDVPVPTQAAKVIPVPVEPPPPVVKPPAPKSPHEMDLEERKQWLFAKLNVEAPWMIGLLEANPILIIGEARCGKSQLGLFILMLRKIYRQHTWEICTPHGHKEYWPKIGKFIPLYGAGANYGAIQERYEVYKQRLLKADISIPHTTIWDEFSEYQSQKVMTDRAGMITSFLADAAKANERPIIIAHGDTSKLLGGTEGTYDMIQRGCVKIQVLGAKDLVGNCVPAGRIRIKGHKKDEMGDPVLEVIDLPKWLYADWLLPYFPEIQTPLPEPDPLENYEAVNVAITPVPVTERLASPEEATRFDRLFHVDVYTLSGKELRLEDLPELERVIVKFFLKRKQDGQTTLSPREVYRGNLTPLKGLNTDSIEKVLQDMTEQEILTFDSELGEYRL